MCTKVQQGLVYAFKGGPSFPKGNFTDDCSGLIPCPEKKVLFLKNFNKFYNQNQIIRLLWFLKTMKIKLDLDLSLQF